jgi:hypothetical protein
MDTKTKEFKFKFPYDLLASNYWVRILGVYFSYDEEACNKLNFESKMQKCKQVLAMWQGRNLTMQGRSQIIKTFIISQFLYTTSSITIPLKYIKEINSLIFKFIWKSKREKIKRLVLQKDKGCGGLNVPNFASMVEASRISWLNKYISGTNHVWKTLFEAFLQMAGFDPSILLFSNYDVSWLRTRTIVPDFYLEVLSLWSEVDNTSQIDKIHFIWYNKNVLIQGKPFCTGISLKKTLRIHVICMLTPLFLLIFG